MVLPQAVRTFTDAELRSRAEWCEANPDIEKPELRMVLEFGQVCRALIAMRETNARLNRRCQSAESGLAEKLEKRSGFSLGRALANSAAHMYFEQTVDLGDQLKVVKAAAREVVAEYYSHAGKGTHQKCDCPCLLAEGIATLASIVGDPLKDAETVATDGNNE